MNIDFALVWAALIAFAVLAYVVLDGFDLGIGILFPFFSDESHRDRMMNAVAPVWDGNETWLVLGGGGLFAVFPLAYSIIMPALYMPVFVMLLALVFRGVRRIAGICGTGHLPLARLWQPFVRVSLLVGWCKASPCLAEPILEQGGTGSRPLASPLAWLWCLAMPCWDQLG